ncbi:MAG: hypothetical protein ACRDZ4_03100 [Egibacteraceae bacterium]
MSWKTVTLFIAGTVALLGAVTWLAFATGRNAEDTTPDVGTREAARAVTPPTVPSPSPAPTVAAPSPAPAVAAPAPSPSPVINGLHVLCPLKGGGYAHLLLTSDTYYKAVTPEEEARLTALLGPPVTNIDPRKLPPKSPTSVTDALASQP